MHLQAGIPEPRKLDDWIGSFMKWSDTIPSPEVFRLWSAYATIGGVLERKVWCDLSGGLLYPSMFVLLVGGPSVGKNQSISLTSRFWVACGQLTIAPESLTKAALIDELNGAQKEFNYEGHHYITSPIVVSAEEFGVLLPEYDKRFLNTLCDLWDCRETCKERTRGGGDPIVISRPCLTLLSGTTPSYLGDTMPESAYQQGFTSRMIMVFCGQKKVKDLFTEIPRDKVLEAKLVHDLKSLGNLVGEFKWTKEAKQFVEEWNRNWLLDAPNHPRLLHYCGRRVIHGMKVAMIISASRSNDLEITLSDIMESKNQLVRVEDLMPEIFKSMTVSTDSNKITEIHRFIFYYCSENKVDSISESKLRHFMQKDIPVHRLTDFIDGMVKSNLIKVVGVDKIGFKTYRAVAISPLD